MSADLSPLLTWQCADELSRPHEVSGLQGAIRGGPQHIPPERIAAAAAMVVVAAVVAGGSATSAAAALVPAELQPTAVIQHSPAQAASAAADPSMCLQAADQSFAMLLAALRITQWLTGCWLELLSENSQQPACKLLTTHMHCKAPKEAIADRSMPCGMPICNAMI
jgi:hypothetical protein